MEFRDRFHDPTRELNRPRYKKWLKLASLMQRIRLRARPDLQPKRAWSQETLFSMSQTIRSVRRLTSTTRSVERKRAATRGATKGRGI